MLIRIQYYWEPFETPLSYAWPITLSPLRVVGQAYCFNLLKGALNMSAIKESGEDYLEAILQLEDDNGQVRSVDVATRLGVTRPSVNKAIANLKSQGMVNQELYGNITLTDKGRKHAKFVVNRHTILKEFLLRVLHVSPEIAENDACRMEHIISEETFIGLKRLLEESNR